MRAPFAKMFPRKLLERGTKEKEIEVKQFASTMISWMISKASFNMFLPVISQTRSWASDFNWI